MEKVFVATALLAMVGALTGCEGSWKINGECTTKSQCKIGGEIGGKFVVEKGFPASALQSIMASGQVFDAAQFSIGLEGTSVGVPDAGMVTVKLIESSSGTVHAARAFPWSRRGGKLVLQDPDVVNDWAYASAGGSDGIAYELHPFSVVGAGSSNVLSLAVKYEGATRATSSTTWSAGSGCRIGACAIQ